MLKLYTAGKSLLPALQGILAQADQVNIIRSSEPVPYVAASYQEVFDEAQTMCQARLSKDDCYRLFGYQPFLCPPKPKAITGEWWLWAAIGVVGGAVVVKLFF